MKLTGILIAFALILIATSPTLAWFIPWTETTQTNNAVIISSTQAGAFTGGNTQFSGVTVEKAGADDIISTSRNNLTTGVARADATSMVFANNSLGCNSCTSPTNRYTEFNGAFITTETLSQAETGTNTQQSGAFIEKAHVDDITSTGTNSLTTGRAVANSNSLTMVNVDLSWQPWPVIN